MFLFFKKATAVIIGTFIVSVGFVMASGKMEVKIGDRTDLVGVSNNSAANYKWTVSKNNEVLTAQTGKNFGYTFDSQGEYRVNLIATSGDKIESTTILVLAGDRYSRFSATPASEAKMGDILYSENGNIIGTVGKNNVVVNDDGKVIGNLSESGEVVTKDGEILGKATVSSKNNDAQFVNQLKTLPPMDSDGRVNLLGQQGKLYFIMPSSYGDIIEYRIDKNIAEDSNNNGISDDDIDNSSDDSYLKGGVWFTEYKQNNSDKIIAEITIVHKSGKKFKKQIEISFKEHKITGDPVAVLHTLPESDNSDNKIHLWEDPHTVYFYPLPSEGKILEYRIDKNIFEDSNGDGDMKNDIDNIDDISFKTGDVFIVDYPKTEDKIIAQLIVVGEGGKGSLVQKEIKFSEKPVSVKESSGIQLLADKNYIVMGDPITFTVHGLTMNLNQYSFDWDFDGDGVVDKTVFDNNVIQHIYDSPGAFTVKVKISDKQGNTANRVLDIVSGEAGVTKANFSYEIDGLNVRFQNLSTVSHFLTDKNLIYKWSFGDTKDDNFEKQAFKIAEENPVYTYIDNGKYLVTLTVTDSAQIMDSKSVEIIVGGGDSTIISDSSGKVDANRSSENTNIFFKLFKIFLFLILIVILLILLIVGGFLIFLKIQHPDLTFEELVDEFKVKILTMIGAHEMPIRENIPPINDSVTSPSEANFQESVDNDISSEIGSDESSDKSEFINEPEGPVPEWLKGTEVIEGEAEEDIPVVNDDFDDNSSFTDGDAEGAFSADDESSDFDEQVLDDNDIQDSDILEDDVSDNEFVDMQDDVLDNNLLMDEDGEGGSIADVVENEPSVDEPLDTDNQILDDEVQSFDDSVGENIKNNKSVDAQEAVVGDELHVDEELQVSPENNNVKDESSENADLAVTEAPIVAQKETEKAENTIVGNSEVPVVNKNDDNKKIISNAEPVNVKEVEKLVNVPNPKENVIPVKVNKVDTEIFNSNKKKKKRRPRRKKKKPFNNADNKSKIINQQNSKSNNKPQQKTGFANQKNSNKQSSKPSNLPKSTNNGGPSPDWLKPQ